MDDIWWQQTSRSVQCSKWHHFVQSYHTVACQTHLSCCQDWIVIHFKLPPLRGPSHRRKLCTVQGLVITWIKLLPLGHSRFLKASQDPHSWCFWGHRAASKTYTYIGGLRSFFTWITQSFCLPSFDLDATSFTTVLGFHANFVHIDSWMWLHILKSKGLAGDSNAYAILALMMFHFGILPHA